MIVLDTHAWPFWRGDLARLGPAARAAIESADEIGVSAISAWAVSTLVRRRCIEPDSDPEQWVRRALAGARTVELPVTAAVVPPPDRWTRTSPVIPRIGYATAVAASAPLATRDRAIAAYDPRRAVW